MQRCNAKRFVSALLIPIFLVLSEGCATPFGQGPEGRSDLAQAKRLPDSVAKILSSDGNLSVYRLGDVRPGALELCNSAEKPQALGAHFAPEKRQIKKKSTLRRVKNVLSSPALYRAKGDPAIECWKSAELGFRYNSVAEIVVLVSFRCNGIFVRYPDPLTEDESGYPFCIDRFSPLEQATRSALLEIGRNAFPSSVELKSIND